MSKKACEDLYNRVFEEKSMNKSAVVAMIGLVGFLVLSPSMAQSNSKAEEELAKELRLTTAVGTVAEG